MAGRGEVMEAVGQQAAAQEVADRQVAMGEMAAVVMVAARVEAVRAAAARVAVTTHLQNRGCATAEPRRACASGSHRCTPR